MPPFLSLKRGLFYYHMAKREKRNRSRGSAGNNITLAENYLEKNKQKEGVVETDSGLQYIVVTEGDGMTPQSGDTVVVHQRALLVNGTVIEDTYRKNESSEVLFDELIEGYQEGLSLMKEGGRMKMFIHPDLGWGKKGSSDKIPPNSLLIFDVKLLEVKY